MPDAWTEGDKLIVDLSASSRGKRVTAGRAQQSEYSGVDLASGFHRDLIWTTKDGRRIALPNMTDSHLLNTIAFLRSIEKQYKRKIATKFMLGIALRDMSTVFHDAPDDVRDAYWEELGERANEQLAKLEAEPTEVFLKKVFPIYGKMLQEAYKRKLLVPNVDMEKSGGNKD